MSNMCPVCGYPGLESPPYTGRGGLPYQGTDGGGSRSFEMCASCGFQFGHSDDAMHITHAQWREKWIANGMPWFSSGIKSPPNWDPREQLKNVGVNI